MATSDVCEGLNAGLLIGRDDALDRARAAKKSRRLLVEPSRDRGTWAIVGVGLVALWRAAPLDWVDYFGGLFPSTRSIAGSASSGCRTRMIFARGAFAWMMLRTRLNQKVVSAVAGEFTASCPLM